MDKANRTPFYLQDVICVGLKMKEPNPYNQPLTLWSARWFGEFPGKPPQLQANLHSCFPP